MAPLQKRALYGLVIGVVWVIAFFTVFIMNDGISTFHEDRGFRLIMDGIAVVGAVAYFILISITFKKSSQLDERDWLILNRAMGVQLTAVIFSVGAWCAVLTLSYRDEGQIPLVFLFLIVMAMVMVSMLAQSIMMLILYWKGVEQ